MLAVRYVGYLARNGGLSRLGVLGTGCGIGLVLAVQWLALMRVGVYGLGMGDVEFSTWAAVALLGLWFRFEFPQKGGGDYRILYRI